MRFSKRVIALMLAVFVVVAFAGCKSNGGTKDSTAATVDTQSTEAQTVSEEEQTDKTAESESEILTVYFSSANTVDATSSATPYFDGVASTQYLAEYINKKVGGDIVKITPTEDYPKSYAGTTAQAKKETDSDARPQFQPLDVNPEDYDIIFIGYPMWWYTLPMIMYTFFDTYDFSGKTIIPFNTHAGSGDGGTYNQIKNFEPGATVLDGLAVSGLRADKADSDIDEWLEEVL